jgi:hypothetical protein
MVVSGGHEKVMGLTVAGKVIVITVAAVAVIVVWNGVRNTLAPGPLSSGNPGLSGLSGGPFITAGQGGKVSVRVLVWPSPSEIGNGIGGMSTLGIRTIPLLVWPAVILTLEYGIPWTVMGGILTVIVVVVVKKVVTTTPPREVVPWWPYSSDVVYSPGLITDSELNELVGKTSVQGGGQETDGDVKTSGPT